MLETAKFIVNLLPILIQLVKAAESAIPEKGQGAVKLAMVQNILESMDASLAESWPLIQKLIAVLVQALNAAKIFND